MLFDPAGLNAVSVTEKVPEVLYCTTGLEALDVEGCPPGNCHKKVVALEDDWLSNVTVRVAHPEVGLAENSTEGTVLINTVLVAVPQSFSTTSVTV